VFNLVTRTLKNNKKNLNVGSYAEIYMSDRETVQKWLMIILIFSSTCDKPDN